MTRVVITGVGGYSPLGKDLNDVLNVLKSKQNRIVKVEELSEYNGMACNLGALVTKELPDYPRKKTRSMGRVGKLATAATDRKSVV